MSRVPQAGEQRIFLRRASGLIKSAGTFDTFVFNIGLVSVGLGVGTIMLYGPAYYPGGDLIWASVLAGAMMTLIAFGMITWTVTLPRSGGIYVFGSRSLPPWLALTLSLVEITAWLFYCAIAAYWIVLIGLAPTLAMIGYITGTQGALGASQWILEPWPLFLIGSAILILSGTILARGMKAYLLSQKIVFTIALLGSVLLIVVLAVGSHENFVARFNVLMTPLLGVDDPYNAIIASARENGWMASEPSFWSTTVPVANWPFLPLIGAAFSIAVGGEVKSVSRSQTIGMLAAIAGSVLVWVITIALCNAVFGYDFLGAAVYNLLEEVGIATPTNPAITLLAGISTNSWIITALVSIGLIFWMWMWIPGMHTFAVRALVAWAFDRIAPAPLGQVSDTRHTPVTAIVFSVIVTILFLAGFVFTDFFSAIVIFIEAAVLAWSIVLLAGIFFPFTRRDLYRRSPISGKTLAGLPLMTVACALGFLASQFFFWNLFFDPIAAGHETNQLITVGGVFLTGVVFYHVMAAIRRSQGIDVRLAFKEIPIE